MSAPKASPIAQSVHIRLLKLSVGRKEDFNAILVRYGNERLLYRLSRTRHAARFILKGASMFVLWLGRVHRPTRDLDLLGSGTINPTTLTAVFQDVCGVPVEPDGLEFDPTSITVDPIREGQAYQGLRVKLRGHLGNARLNIQIDVGLGDAVTPTPEVAQYPTLLDMPAPRMKVYPRETAVAEKLDAMIELGMKNSRMKDYYDIALLARHFEFSGVSLSRAIEATLRRRGRELPSQLPTGLTPEFAADVNKAVQWKAFTRNHRESELPTDLSAVVQQVRDFLEPPLSALVAKQPFTKQWSASGPWR